MAAVTYEKDHGVPRGGAGSSGLTREQVTAARADGPAHVQVGFRPENTGLVGPDDGGMPIHVDLVEELGSTRRRPPRLPRAQRRAALGWIA